MIHQDTITLETGQHGQMHRIDGEVQAVVSRSRLTMGTVHLFNIGSTASIGTIEYEDGLIGDYPAMLDRLIPPSRQYGHEQAWHDGNAHSHLQATLMGPELTVPFREGRLLLGTWQQIVHLELDIKPRTRTIVVTVHGNG